MFDNIKWLFFDVGSTLTDESQCYNKRCIEAIENTDITYDEFVSKVMEFTKQNKKGDHEAVKYYGLTLPNWHTELEILYPDVKYVLSSLSEQYKIGIIANQSFGTKDRLAEWEILKYIDIVVASAEEGVSKPNPEIFLSALSRAECKPENAVMIGDRMDNDIIPAKKIGMKTIWIKQGFAKYQEPKCEEEKADIEVSNLTQIIDILLK